MILRFLTEQARAGNGDYMLLPSSSLALAGPLLVRPDARAAVLPCAVHEGAWQCQGTSPLPPPRPGPWSLPAGSLPPSGHLPLTAAARPCRRTSSCRRRSQRQLARGWPTGSRHTPAVASRRSAPRQQRRQARRRTCQQPCASPGRPPAPLPRPAARQQPRLTPWRGSWHARAQPTRSTQAPPAPSPQPAPDPAAPLTACNVATAASGGRGTCLRPWPAARSATR